MSGRAAFVVVAVLSAALRAQDPAPKRVGTGVVRGMVTAAATGQPIRGVDIRLSGGSITTFEPRWVRTDEKGRFEVRGLDAGRYNLTAQKVGYITLNYGQTRPGEAGRPVEVSEGTPLDDINFAMPRGGVIVARMTDAFGDPLRGIVVRPLVPAFSFTTGERQLQQAPGSAMNATDDRGEVRLYGLAPGEYYLITDNVFLGATRDDAPTFYPGTLQASEALPVRIGVGEEVPVAFSTIRVRPARLSGVIIGSNGTPLTTPQVSFARPTINGGSSRRMTVEADGSFNEENLLAGDYVIQVREPEFGTVTVRVFGDDITGLAVNTRKPATVRGRLTFEGAPPPDREVQIRPAFLGTAPMPGLSAGVLRSRSGVGSIAVGPDDDWTFEATIAGLGVLRFQNPPTSAASGWFLKTVLLDGKDVTDTPLDFSTNYDGKKVEVVLTRKSSEISGTVADARGQIVRDCAVAVFPEDETQWTMVSRHIAAARPDQEGRFALHGLPPGRYLIAAVDYLASSQERNPETLARLRADATSFTLAEGETRTQNLRLDR